MEQETHCEACRYFNRYYTKGVKRFNPTQFGCCSQKMRTACERDCCNKFKRKPAPKRNEKLTLYVLNDLFTELTHIREVIEDTYREDL